MKVLLLGATGNLGLRLVASLLTHNHTVVAFVRSCSKLQSLLSPSIYKQLTVVQGSATDASAVKNAILVNDCHAVVNTAGLAALSPWKKSGLNGIFKAVLEGVKGAGEERGKPLRAWFLAGYGVLKYPGSDTMLSNYIPIYLEHRANLSLLSSLPASTISWSPLRPLTMTPESSSSSISIPARSRRPKLIANATSPPQWRDLWVAKVPVVGRVVACAVNAGRYETTLEQNADFIAEDLERGGSSSEWVGKAVGVVDPER